MKSGFAVKYVNGIHLFSSQIFSMSTMRGGRLGGGEGEGEVHIATKHRLVRDKKWSFQLEKNYGMN